MRRRPSTIHLTLMGMSALTLVGCDQKDDTGASTYFGSEAECASKADPEQCRTAAEQAKAAHLQNAPKFTSREECEKTYGANGCVTPGTAGQTASGGSWFMPAMTGFMIGRMMGGGGSFVNPVYQRGNQRFMGAGARMPFAFQAPRATQGFTAPGQPNRSAYGTSQTSRGGFGGFRFSGG